MQFHKFQALGNDFLILREEELAAVHGPFEPLARRLCDRHFGAGADGVEVLLQAAPPPGEADFAVRLFNADGGETPISGNGTRCVAAYLYLVAGWRAPSVRIATGAGVKELFPIDRGVDYLVFETSMGLPRLASAEIPVNLPEPLARVVGRQLDLPGERISFTSVSMGNPHCSIFVDNFESIDWRRLGAAIETHPLFPDRTNVEFIRVTDRETIEVRFWERGCGETLSSGTGSCAAALAAMLNDRTDRRLRVCTVAGELLVEWRDDGSVWQTGEARAVYRGEWLEGRMLKHVGETQST